MRQRVEMNDTSSRSGGNIYYNYFMGGTGIEMPLGNQTNG